MTNEFQIKLPNGLLSIGTFTHEGKSSLSVGYKSSHFEEEFDIDFFSADPEELVTLFRDTCEALRLGNFSFSSTRRKSFCEGEDSI